MNEKVAAFLKAHPGLLEIIGKETAEALQTATERVIGIDILTTRLSSTHRVLVISRDRRLLAELGRKWRDRIGSLFGYSAYVMERLDSVNLDGADHLIHITYVERHQTLRPMSIESYRDIEGTLKEEVLHRRKRALARIAQERAQVKRFNR